MGKPLEITRLDASAEDLRVLAARTHDGDVVRRLLGIAMVLDGAPRAVAAEACGMDRQTLCYWVHRYNDEGVPGLSSRPIPGRPPVLTEAQLADFRELVIAGPDPERDEVVRWRCADLQQQIADRYGAEVHERTVGKMLHRLGPTLTVNFGKVFFIRALRAHRTALALRCRRHGGGSIRRRQVWDWRHGCSVAALLQQLERLFRPRPSPACAI